MADPTQLELLHRSVAEWNTWREQYREIVPDLTDADLTGANLTGADLRSANLTGADLRSVDLRSVDLRSANLTGADLSDADLRSANLSNAQLIEVDFSIANLSGTDLSNSSLSGADLRSTDLSNADLRSTSLSYANLSGADLNGADLSNANIEETSLGDRDFRVIKGLETIIHAGPSSLSINSLYLSEGNIPDAFVRGTGAPDTFLEYMHALAAHPIKYYTCFISYSSNDQGFADRLYNDLQANNVRCWYAPENLKTGDFFWKRIDESIRLHDKLLVVLSSHSVESDWVEREVMAALEKESQQKRPVLFPLRLDEAVKTTSAPWVADMRRRRHITDFTGWEADYTVYQAGLKRVLRDLKQEQPR